MKLNKPDIDKLMADYHNGKEIDITRLTAEKLAEELSTEYGKPQLFVITIMINTKMSVNTIAQVTDLFLNQLPSEDWSKNIMTCDYSKLVEK